MTRGVFCAGIVVCLVAACKINRHGQTLSPRADAAGDAPSMDAPTEMPVDGPIDSQADAIIDVATDRQIDASDPINFYDWSFGSVSRVGGLDVLRECLTEPATTPDERNLLISRTQIVAGECDLENRQFEVWDQWRSGNPLFAGNIDLPRASTDSGHFVEAPRSGVPPRC